MFRSIRFALSGVAALLMTACASEPGPSKPETPHTPPTVGSTEADTYFAMFMNDPTNRDGWHWLCRAAAGGHTAAQYTVGVRYRNGMPPVARDPSRAYLWFAAAGRGGLTAGTIAAEAVAKTLPDARLRELRKKSRPPTEVDCRENG